MVFGNPAVEQNTPSAFATAFPNIDPSSREARELLWQLGLGEGAPSGVGGSVADEGTSGAANIGIGPASGSPGTGGIGGLAASVMGALGFMSNPIGFVVQQIANNVLGKKSSEEQIMNFLNNIMAGGNPGGGGIGVNDDSNAAPGNQAVSGNTGIAVGPDADAQQNNPQGITAGPDAADAAAANADAAAAAAAAGVGTSDSGFAKGGVVTADKVRGPKPNRHDDGTTGIKVGEYVIKTAMVPKIGKDVLDKLNSGDFDPAMLRFAVLRKVGK